MQNKNKKIIGANSYELLNTAETYAKSIIKHFFATDNNPFDERDYKKRQKNLSLLPEFIKNAYLTVERIIYDIKFFHYTGARIFSDTICKRLAFAKSVLDLHPFLALV
ncbi:hypothetical protein GF340_06180 [Candidatus Peregrinibacteria bacterium]|nr:hypothetical protein [Candidatus Peregrinibacteria bacterium]